MSSTRSFSRYARQSLAALEQRQRVARLECGFRTTAPTCSSASRRRRVRSPRCLRGDYAVRRHADIGDDDVGALGLDRREERLKVTADGGDLEIGLRLGAERPDALADEVVILGEDEANGRTAEEYGRDGRERRARAGSRRTAVLSLPRRDTPAATISGRACCPYCGPRKPRHFDTRPLVPFSVGGNPRERRHPMWLNALQGYNSAERCPPGCSVSLR